MTDVLPIFVTRVNLAKASDTVLISLEAPSGDVTSATIETREVARVVLSDQTFRQVCELFARTLRVMDAAKDKPAMAAPRETRVFSGAEPQAPSADEKTEETRSDAPQSQVATKH